MELGIIILFSVMGAGFICFIIAVRRESRKLSKKKLKIYKQSKGGII